MTKRNVGFLGSQLYMKKAINDIKTRLNVHEFNPQTWKKEELDAIAQQCRERNISSVAGMTQKDAFYHILINERLGNTVPTRLAFLYCMNKYLMRTLETNPFWFDYVDPINESDDEIIEKIIEWPFMLKNTYVSLELNIFKIKNEDDLRSVFASYRADTKLQERIAFQNEQYIEGIPKEDLPPIIPPFVAEHMVDMNLAIEYCYEGYISATGEIVHYALTEAVCFSSHQTLGYLTPPISIDTDMVPKIEAWVDDYMSNFIEVGYIGQFFNINFWMLPDGAIALIEINPYTAHSYHYNYQYSFGNSLYEDNLELAATGKHLQGNTPWQKWRDSNDFSFTLIVLITTNETGNVSDILDYDYIRQLEEEAILIRHTCQKNDVLIDSDLTAAGVILQQIWITGKTKKEVIAKEHKVRANIYKKPNTESKYPAYWSL